MPSWQPTIQASLASNDLLLPLLVGVAAVTGLVLQHSEMKGKTSEDGDGDG